MKSAYKLDSACFRAAIVLIIVCLWNLCVFAAGHKPKLDSQWERIHTEDEFFSIYLPARLPVYFRENHRVEGSSALIKSERIVRGFEDGAVFIVYAYETSESKKLFDDKVALYQAKFKSKQQKLEINGFRGAVIFKSENSTYQTAKVFVGNNQVFVIETATRKTGDPLVSQFFSSLKLGNTSAQSNEVVLSSKTTSNAQTSPVAAAQTYENKDVTNQARLLFVPIPPRIGAYNGATKVKMVISESGEPIEIETSKNLPEKVSRYLESIVKYAIFIPADKDGRFVRQKGEIMFNFTGSSF